MQNTVFRSSSSSVHDNKSVVKKIQRRKLHGDNRRHDFSETHTFILRNVKKEEQIWRLQTAEIARASSIKKTCFLIDL